MMQGISEVFPMKEELLPLSYPATEPGWSYRDLELNIAEDISRK